MKVNRQQQGVDTDTIIKTVYYKMSLDLAYLPGIKAKHWVRGDSYPLAKYSDPYVYKAKYQLNTLLKRYVTKDEVQNVEVNKKKAFESFKATQERLAVPRALKSSSLIVVQAARKIIKDLLGKYDRDTHAYCSRFGRRAAVGLNYRDSYLDERVRTLTGSPDHVQWFRDSVVGKDDLLCRSLSRGYSEIQTLTLSDVPKTWDKRRTILKNTVIGGFHSAGLGEYMVKRLRDNGINLSRVSEKHANVIKTYSRDLSHVTADLSSASDSFTTELVNRLFPRSWFNAMRQGRIRYVEIDGKVYYCPTFMTMGIGFTFPAQTIAFRSILKAISDLTGIRGSISVFGDDLIYPTKMHPYVRVVLEDLGFILNEDKTFVTTPFRESCGADFYDGVAVRPFQPEGQHEVLDGMQLLAHLYKLYNGLHTRWSEVELPETFAYLKRKMLLKTEFLHQVPEDFPVTSGIQKRCVSFDPDFLQPRRCVHGSYIFQCLSHKLRLREVPFQTPYLWEFLRVKELLAWRKIDIGNDIVDTGEVLDDRFTDPTDSAVLTWVWRKRRVSRHGRAPIWKWRLVPHVSEKGSTPIYAEDWTTAVSFELSR